MKSYWYKSNNVGDTLTQVLIEHFLGVKPEWVDKKYKGKLLAVGSILGSLNENDVIWGAGLIRDADKELPKNVKILALRGPKTAERLGIKYSPIYGDPAILLPLIYNPTIQKKKEIGFIPHYIDKDEWKKETPDFIDIELPWKEVVDKILECQKVVSSSLHGIIIAEAYGIPAIWMQGSDKIVGGDFKFQDYFLGTGRQQQVKEIAIPAIENLKDRQDVLLKALKDHYDI